jgi:hypothetical protein
LTFPSYKLFERQVSSFPKRTPTLVCDPATPVNAPRAMIYIVMRTFLKLKLMLAAALLVSTLAFGQADQSSTAQQPSSQPATSQPPTTTPPAKARPTTPHPIVDAARASKQLQASSPPAKVYRNKDVKDPADAGSSTAAGPGTTTTSAAGSAVTPAASSAGSQPAATTSASTAAQTDAAQIQKDRAFEAQAKVFKSQILAEKGKIADIKNRMTDLKYQFDQWSTQYSQDPYDAQACWTSAYYTPYNKDWCDTGRNLKAQYDAAQRQLEQEKARLDQMQENIRRQGYGNGVYDPD